MAMVERHQHSSIGAAFALWEEFAATPPPVATLAHLAAALETWMRQVDAALVENVLQERAGGHFRRWRRAQVIQVFCSWRETASLARVIIPMARSQLSSATQ